MDGAFVYSFDVCRVSYPFPPINYEITQNDQFKTEINNVNLAILFLKHTNFFNFCCSSIMDLKFQVCLLLIILGTIYVQDGECT